MTLNPLGRTLRQPNLCVYNDCFQAMNFDSGRRPRWPRLVHGTIGDHQHRFRRLGLEDTSVIIFCTHSYLIWMGEEVCDIDLVSTLRSCEHSHTFHQAQKNLYHLIASTRTIAVDLPQACLLHVRPRCLSQSSVWPASSPAMLRIRRSCGNSAEMEETDGPPSRRNASTTPASSVPTRPRPAR